MNAARSGRLIIFMYLFTAFHHLARKKQGEQRDITICCETILSHKPGRFYFKLALPSVCLHKPWHLLHLDRPELQSWNLWNVPGWWGSHTTHFAFALGSGAHTGISPFPFQDVKAPRSSGWVWLSSPHCHWIFNWIFISTSSEPGLPYHSAQLGNVVRYFSLPFVKEMYNFIFPFAGAPRDPSHCCLVWGRSCHLSTTHSPSPKLCFQFLALWDCPAWEK